MIVCLCRGVADRTNRAAIARGASSPDAITEACGAGGDCRSCCPMLEDLIEEVRSRAHHAVPVPQLVPA